MTDVTQTPTQESVGTELSDSLLGTPTQRVEEEKTIHLRFTPGTKPEVTFTGFWNGNLIRAAMNAISRVYRRRRHKPQTLPHAREQAKPSEEGKEK